MTAPASRRGRETAFDMLRSLAIVFCVVLPLWFFGQASPSDSKRIRPVDPAEALRAFVQDLHGPVPRSTPPGWVVNVAKEDGVSVRVGYVIGDHYTEFAGGRGASFLDDATGHGVPRGSLRINGASWRDYLSPDGRESLVLQRAGVVVVVGGVREDVTFGQLQQLAATVG